MGVRMKDLPPKVREQVARKMVQDTSSGAARHLPLKGKANTPGLAGHLLPGEGKGTCAGMEVGKYRNQKAVREIGGNAVWFDSQKKRGGLTSWCCCSGPGRSGI